MNLEFFREKLESSEVYKKFIEENPEAYLCSAFFIVDFSGEEKNQYHLDFYDSSKEKWFSFSVDEEIKEIPVNKISEESSKPFKLVGDSNLNFDEVKILIQDKMSQEGIKPVLKKLIMVIQNIDGRDYFVITAFISMLGLLKVHIDCKDKKITLFEKKNFFEMLKKR